MSKLKPLTDNQKKQLSEANRKTPEEILEFAYNFRCDNEYGYLLGNDDIIRSLHCHGDMTEAEAVDFFETNWKGKK